MIAYDKTTGEIKEGLDPSNDEDEYYRLDKRVWEFIEEFTERAWIILKGRIK